MKSIYIYTVLINVHGVENYCLSVKNTKLTFDIAKRKLNFSNKSIKTLCSYNIISNLKICYIHNHILISKKYICNCFRLQYLYFILGDLHEVELMDDEAVPSKGKGIEIESNQLACKMKFTPFTLLFILLCTSYC